MRVADICEKAQEIPCSPSVLPSLLRLLNDENASIDEFQKIIRQDTGLSGSVLKLANSAYFGAGNQYDNLDQAILHLGFRQTYEAIASVAGGRWSSFDAKGYGWEPGDFCRHSFTVAIASELVAMETGVCKPELAYTAGLMQDAGKLAIAYVDPEGLESVRQHQAKAQCPWLESEQSILGFDHAEVCGALLEGWRFPETLIEAGRWYFAPSKASEANRSLVCCVHVGKHLAIETGIGGGEDAFWTNLEGEAVTSLNMDESDLRALLPALTERLRALLKDEIQSGRIRF